MLAPIAHPEDNVWREYLNGLQPGSITVSGFVEPIPNTRVWMNGEEITHMISNVTVERAVGQRTRIGFNGGEPEVRDNVRVEVEQDGAIYVIDETRAVRETPLQRLSTDPLRRLASQARPDGYWSYEPSAVEDWMAANPIVTAAPIPPSPEEVMDNMRRYMRLIEDQPTFVGNEDTVQRVNLFGHDMDIVTSPLVPDNTIIAIDNAALNRARDEALANMSFGFDVSSSRDFARAALSLRYSMNGVGESFRPLIAGMAGVAVRRFLDRKPERRSHGRGYTAPRNNPRMRKLHTDYSRRRRRNR